MTHFMICAKKGICFWPDVHHEKCIICFKKQFSVWRLKNVSEVFMKTFRKSIIVLTVLLALLAASCATSGNYMPSSKDEAVIGNAQTTFVVKSSALMFKNGKSTVDTQSYIHLLEAAGKDHTGVVDIRDIVWVTGRTVGIDNTEISATGKVVRME